MTSFEQLTEARLQGPASYVGYSQPTNLAAGTYAQELRVSSVNGDVREEELNDEAGKYDMKVKDLKDEDVNRDVKRKNVKAEAVKAKDVRVGYIRDEEQEVMDDNEDGKLDDRDDEDEQMASSEDEPTEYEMDVELSNEGDDPEDDAKDLEEARRDDDRIEEEDLWVREVRFRDREGLWVYNERRRWFELRL